jgi:hypothetical protein
MMRYMLMRTTIDLPDADHLRLKSIAEMRGVSLGKLLVELANSALGIESEERPVLARNKQTGLLVMPAKGGLITGQKIRALMEDFP